jgi:nicotinamidase-related amidase
MPATDSDLHGNVPDTADVALLIIDMINDMEFEGGEQLLAHALPVARQIATLKRQAREANIPVIYANDNFGRWRSDFRQVVDHCLSAPVRGAPVARLVVPDPDDYFVLKPKHSAFFSTTLETLLRYLNAKKLILTGIATDSCVLFTAHDAYMRDYELYVPEDCVAAIDWGEHTHALGYMQRVMKCSTQPAPTLDLMTLAAERIVQAKR